MAWGISRRTRRRATRLFDAVRERGPAGLPPVPPRRSTGGVPAARRVSPARRAALAVDAARAGRLLGPDVLPRVTGAARDARPGPGDVAAAGSPAVAESTLRYLMYGLLPFWFLPGAADWWMHRRTRIEDSPGLRESLIHALMMTEVGVPILLTLRYEVNPLLLTVQAGATAAHEATALWDVRTAHDSAREVRPAEQHIHSFLESLPFSALTSLACLHPAAVRSLLRGGRGDGDAWRFVRRRRPLPAGYLGGVAAGVGLFVVLPYAEELLRCGRAEWARRKRAGRGRAGRRERRSARGPHRLEEGAGACGRRAPRPLRAERGYGDEDGDG